MEKYSVSIDVMQKFRHNWSFSLKNQGYLLNDATVSCICLLQNQYSEKKSFTNEVSNRWNHEEDKQ